MSWWHIISSGDLIKYKQPVQNIKFEVSRKKNLNQQRKTENRIEKMYCEIMWPRARIDLTAVWDADLACWSCRFRTYLAWAGFYRRARHPHGSWRGDRPLSPAGATSRPGSAPRRATSHWSATRGCWAGEAPGSRAEGFLSEEKQTKRQRNSGESLRTEDV